MCTFWSLLPSAVVNNASESVAWTVQANCRLARCLRVQVFTAPANRPRSGRLSSPTPGGPKRLRTAAGVCVSLTASDSEHLSVRPRPYLASSFQLQVNGKLHPSPALRPGASRSLAIVLCPRRLLEFHSWIKQTFPTLRQNTRMGCSAAGAWPVRCRIFSGVPGIYSLDTRDTLSLDKQKSPDMPKCFLGQSHPG
uniref:Uncharacterized protein n=1 Tax=Rousettus aegyptiacus TaxID=9407 RepID=A0A7J8GAJ0_ROUAE|nr:hypothetical protein HJG63_011575 [Rousettus aegyptiacus]